MEKTPKKGLLEKGANFFEKLHYAIGGAALAGYAIFQKEILAVVGIYEVAHGLVINGIKNWFKNRSNNKSSPKLAPA